MAAGESYGAHAHADARTSGVFFDFVERAHAANDADDLNDAAVGALSRLGFSHVIAASISDPGDGGSAHARMIFGRPNIHWLRHYLSRHYFDIDAMTPFVRHGIEPIAWSDVRQRVGADHPGMRVMYEAAEFGLMDGFVSPIHEADGTTLAAVMAADGKINLCQRERAAAHLVGIYFMSNARRLLAERPMEMMPLCLTPRQRECLRWVRDGKTDWEIGRILGISEQTVMAHVKAARRALGVRTRAQAVAEALSRGEITL